mmetsp:Transcript_48189/g.112747  ORF Transcript_48189/g.112747 Transcript_48189/m.112747 type:complete len:398 (-) Transcript_48189:91-1284(-)
MRDEPPTRITSVTSFMRIRASCNAWKIGSRQRSIKSPHSSMNFSVVKARSKWRGPSSLVAMKGTEIVASRTDDSSILAFSAASEILCSACGSVRRSIPVSDSKVSANQLRIRKSKSSPPSLVSPPVASTSHTPSPVSIRDTSKVPPPRSRTNNVARFLLSRPYAKAAIVGSLDILSTSRPAILPASLVACRWASLKYAGTVMTAFSTDASKNSAASSRSFFSTCADTSSGCKCPSAVVNIKRPSASLTVYGTRAALSLTSDNFRPMKRLTEWNVDVGFSAACLFAASPTRISLLLVNATILGVPLEPSAFGITSGRPASTVATTDVVVPKSMPTTFSSNSSGTASLTGRALLPSNLRSRTACGRFLRESAVKQQERPFKRQQQATRNATLATTGLDA